MAKNTNPALSTIVSRLKQHLIALIKTKDPASLLKGKNLAMYMSAGCVTGRHLAQQLVSDYLSQTIEQNSGWLYETILEESGLEKVTDKKSEGRHNLDFIHRTSDEIRLVGLAAASNTKNSSATKKWRDDMDDNLAFWERQNNDNPLMGARKVVKVWALARGAPANREIKKTDIRLVRGDDMWKYFDLGRGFSKKIESELRKQKFTPKEIKDLKLSAENVLVDFLVAGGFLKNRTGPIAYTKLLKAYP